MRDVFDWRGQAVAFRPGESLACALAAAGVVGYGPDSRGGATRYFCGIGTCQACLVLVDGVVAEACLTPAHAGLTVTALSDDPAFAVPEAAHG